MQQNVTIHAKVMESEKKDSLFSSEQKEKKQIEGFKYYDKLYILGKETRFAFQGN